MASSTRPLAPDAGAAVRPGPQPGAARRPGGPWPVRLTLGAVVLAGLGLRLWSLEHGLPFAYNPDERHFLPIAVGMFSGDPNPHYFENPAALTYLLHLVLRALHPLGGDGYRAEFDADATGAFLTGRVVVALLGAVGVGLV